jgi:heme-degrading monooxygenase HmoA
MYARVNRIEVPPEAIDDGVRRFQETILPRVRELDGYRGLVSLADRSTGTLMTIFFWESEDAMRASEEAASRIRGDAAAAANVSGEVIVERYEVTMQE